MEVRTDVTSISTPAKVERPESSCSSSISRISKKKHRTKPAESSEQMLQPYLPSPRLQLSSTLILSPRLRQPRYDYYDLTLNDQNLNSAWIRFNEEKIDQLQKRIDLMLQIDDHEESEMLLSRIHPITNTVTEHIDEILYQKPKRGNSSVYSSNDGIGKSSIEINLVRNFLLVLPRENPLRITYRLNETFPQSSRSTPRRASRSTTPTVKSVRITTKKDRIPKQIRFDEETMAKSSTPRPVVSILRRSNPSSTSRPRRIVEKSHIWKNDIDGKVYILDQFSIPRYYRLYNDVSFREVYQFSRLLESYLDPHHRPSEAYASMIKDFALEQRLPTIRNAA